MPGCQIVEQLGFPAAERHRLFDEDVDSAAEGLACLRKVLGGGAAKVNDIHRQGLQETVERAEDMFGAVARSQIRGPGLVRVNDRHESRIGVRCDVPGMMLGDSTAADNRDSEVVHGNSSQIPLDMDTRSLDTAGG
jgi:hypothetical protein